MLFPLEHCKLSHGAPEWAKSESQGRQPVPYDSAGMRTSPRFQLTSPSPTLQAFRASSPQKESMVWGQADWPSHGPFNIQPDACQCRTNGRNDECLSSIRANKYEVVTPNAKGIMCVRRIRRAARTPRFGGTAGGVVSTHQSGRWRRIFGSKWPKFPGSSWPMCPMRSAALVKVAQE